MDLTEIETNCVVVHLLANRVCAIKKQQAITHASVHVFVEYHILECEQNIVSRERLPV